MDRHVGCTQPYTKAAQDIANTFRNSTKSTREFYMMAQQREKNRLCLSVQRANESDTSTFFFSFPASVWRTPKRVERFQDRGGIHPQFRSHVLSSSYLAE